MAGTAKSPLHVGLLVVWAACVASLTLRTVEVVGSEPEIATLCLLCGDRGLADAVLNVVLFLPLGVVLAATGRARWRSAGVAGLTISLLIEFGQVLIPGRHPTAGDVVWNAAGAIVGALLWAWLSARSRASQPSERGAVAAICAGIAVIASGVLLSPDPTDSDYWGQWTPDLGYMPRYEGRVTEAYLNDRPLPSGRIDWAVEPRSELDGSWEIRATVTVGPPPPAVSPIISIYDREEREILLLGADGEDVVLRERTLAKTLRLDQPDLRIEGLFGQLSSGEAVSLGARREGGRRCIHLGGVERCEMAFGPGRGWGLLYFPDGIGADTRRALDIVWIALLFLPIGLLSTSTRLAVMSSCGAGVLAFAMAPVLTRLVPASPAEYGGAAFGLVVGLLARRLPIALDSELQMRWASNSTTIS